MKYVDEFRAGELVSRIASRVRSSADRNRSYTFMEVCGTHTMAVSRFGLNRLLPDNIRLISGPGCPVCVTPNSYIDKAIAISKLPGVIVATFGDMIRVPGSYSSLERERALGSRIRVVYSTDDALDIARKEAGAEVVFLGIGFETTAPTVAASILAAEAGVVKNYSVLCGHKTMPEVLKSLAADRSACIDGFLLPGHVSAVIGAKPYRFLPEVYRKRCVISGFEPSDIMESILMLISQKRPTVEIEYSRAAVRSGNKTARRVMERVFAETDSEWRGMGNIRSSGLKIRKKFRAFDAARRFRLKDAASRTDKRCICGDILRGLKTPRECALFRKACDPTHPVGACMVSSEGTCAAYYRYRR
jgi:hydrogenase expression/formation protein HypD